MRRYSEWSGALAVTAVTAVLVALDLADGSVHRYWARHPFTASVVAGVLVLLLTVLIVDRVARMRALRNQSRAIAAQAAIMVGQARRAGNAVTSIASGEDGPEQAGEQLRSFAQMLFTSAPVLLNARLSRAFLETAQHTGAELYRALREAESQHLADAKTRVDDALAQLRGAAEPLVGPLTAEQRAAVSSGQLYPP